VRGALKHSWIFNINDLMLIKPLEDLQEDYYHPTLCADGEQRDLLQTIPSMVIRNIILLQEWFKEQASINQRIWMTLTAEAFANWKALQFHRTSQPTNAVESPITANITTPTVSEATSFQHGTK
jgi:hypothetical protein